MPNAGLTWNPGSVPPANDRLVLAFAPGVDDPEESELECKHVWMGWWIADENSWNLLVPGTGGSFSVDPHEVEKWTELPVP